MRLFSQVFQQQVQFPFAVHRHTALDAQSIVLRQEIRVDAGDGNEHFRLTVGAAAVHAYPPAFVAQTVALRGKLRQRLRGKNQSSAITGLIDCSIAHPAMQSTAFPCEN